MARILRPTPRNLAILAGVLRRGGLVAVPTETVYGLAADAGNADACRGIFRAKRRPLEDPLIVHVPGRAEATVLAEVGAVAGRLMEVFWPGALTLVLRRREVVPDVVTGGRETVAVRSPRHPVLQELLKKAGVPLAAPSANPFGYVSPTTAGHVAESLGERIEWILDGGPSEIGVESTIVDVSTPSRPRLLRPGGVPAEEIEAHLGVRLVRARSGAKRGGVEAPGTLASHYRPRAGVVLVTPGRLQELAEAVPAGAGVLAWRDVSGADPRRVVVLAPDGRVATAARRLFGALRALDGAGCGPIYASLGPEEGLGRAVNDRLRRAAAPVRPGHR